MFLIVNATGSFSRKSNYYVSHKVDVLWCWAVPGTREQIFWRLRFLISWYILSTCVLSWLLSMFTPWYAKFFNAVLASLEPRARVFHPETHKGSGATLVLLTHMSARHNWQAVPPFAQALCLIFPSLWK